MPGRIPQEVFISHSSLDEPFVTALAETLQRHGVPIWYSRHNIQGAQQWHDEIGSALRRCDWFVLVLSDNAVASMWVKRELTYVLQQERYQDRIAPVMYSSCDTDQLSWVLSSIQTIDFRQDPDEGYRQLLRMWGIGYRP
jgi:hypothetical protein